jgi:membrane-associated phospholipid phosphatase
LATSGIFVGKLKFYQEKDIIVIAYQLLMVITILFSLKHIPNPFHFITGHVLLIAFIYWFGRVKDTQIRSIIKNFYPIIIILLNFMELHYLVHTINPNDIDRILIEIDHMLFGCHPTVMLEVYNWNLLTEYLQIIYASFYFLPIILTILLYCEKKGAAFRFFIFTIVLGFYLSYVGYFLFPAIGPRFTLDHYQQGFLAGIFLTDYIKAFINNVENIQRDCFPSGHTEIAVLTLIYAYKYHKPYFWILTIVVPSLILSTVYLRYHYVVDLIAGIVLALMVYFIATPVYRFLEKRTCS